MCTIRRIHQADISWYTDCCIPLHLSLIQPPPNVRHSFTSSNLFLLSLVHPLPLHLPPLGDTSFHSDVFYCIGCVTSSTLMSSAASAVLWYLFPLLCLPLHRLCWDTSSHSDVFYCIGCVVEFSGRLPLSFLGWSLTPGKQRPSNYLRRS